MTGKSVAKMRMREGKDLIAAYRVVRKRDGYRKCLAVSGSGEYFESIEIIQVRRILYGFEAQRPYMNQVGDSKKPHRANLYRNCTTLRANNVIDGNTQSEQQ